MRMPMITGKDAYPLPSLFDDFLNAFFDDGNGRDCQLMAVDVVEKATAYEVKANFPGLVRENIQISVRDRDMILEARQEADKQEDKGIYHLKERYAGQWRRSIRLPDNSDPTKITARLDNGVLTVVIPKVEPSPNRQIVIE